MSAASFRVTSSSRIRAPRATAIATHVTARPRLADYVARLG